MSTDTNNFPKVCWFCLELAFDEGHPDWSDETPGDRMELYCRKRHWKFRQFKTTLAEFREYILKSQTCSDFKMISDIND